MFTISMAKFDQNRMIPNYTKFWAFIYKQPKSECYYHSDLSLVCHVEKVNLQVHIHLFMSSLKNLIQDFHLSLFQNITIVLHMKLRIKDVGKHGI